MSDSKVREAIALARAGRRRQARELFLEIVAQDPYNEVAWLWLAGLLDDVDDQIVALENALVLNPDNHRARSHLERLRQRQEAPAPPPASPTADTGATKDDASTYDAPMSARTLLARGRWHEHQGRIEQAISLYEQALALGETRRERQVAGKRLKEMRRRLELSQPVPKNTTFTLVRLSIGPFLLYLLLLFVHAAYRPWRASPLLCLGALPVLFGTLLLVGARITPGHPWWRRLLGVRQLQARWRAGLALLGLFLLFLPYLLFLSSALSRLNP